MDKLVGDVLEGTVVRVYPRYAILLFDDLSTGLLHISEVSNSYVRNFTGYVMVGNIYKVKIISLGDDGSMKVSLKRLSEAERHHNFRKRHIDPADISFQTLEKELPIWIKEENDGTLEEKANDHQDD
jgi:predicted RNA-binding protein with RPS1 domain